MALVKPFIFQIVGYKNSGKTTVMTELIKRLKADGLNVVSIKHHGHGGKPEAATSNDSTKHLESGALASIVEGDGSLLLQAEKKTWTLEEKIQLAAFFKPDVILIEGHKHETYPKLLLLRRKEDFDLLQLRNVQVVMLWEEVPKDASLKDIPSFYLNDTSAIDWVTDYLENQL
ncbi:MAG: molybdopterin-guanine dinucleotide biosynthesis protein B [Bacillota bacterium]|nr:molybdopterin-guanine dinucleotide biosynthesis protein B [Bacillota bacterium]